MFESETFVVTKMKHQMTGTKQCVFVVVYGVFQRVTDMLESNDRVFLDVIDGSTHD